MPRTATFTCDDPIPYQAAIRGGEADLSITARGDFRAKLIQIDLHKLWMQSGWENLPRVLQATVSPKRMAIQFLADARQPALQHTGLELHNGAFIALPPGSLFHFRSQSPCHWATMSLTPETFAAASNALLGRELTAGSEIRFVHPDPAHMTRLVLLHTAARQLAIAAPDTLAHPEVAGALEHQLVHAWVTCLVDEAPTTAGSGWRQHTAIINRFEQVLSKNFDRPMYLAEICAAVGASERVLQSSCEEHLGMAPLRYLWLRRMHLARRALLRADPSKATVTQIATDHGFWELGRFSVAYQGLFGEPPSASLRKPSDYHKAIQASPLSLAASDFA
jgi:AraC-like DNA-binding protein